MTHVTGTIITDCADPNTQARQELRFESLFGVKPTFLGVDDYESLEAAGSLVDQLDILVNFPLANKRVTNVILINVAPRVEEVKRRWDNGTPFCYFWYQNSLIVSTYEGYSLTLVRDLRIVDKVAALDIPTVTAAAVGWGDLTKSEAHKINNSQFRSLEFLPLVAYWLFQNKPVPSETLLLVDLPDPSNRVWLVDNFSLVKTTLLPGAIGYEPGKVFTLANGEQAACYPRLADVPTGVTGLTIGSSGFGNNRFIEIAVGGGGRAGDRHQLAVGSTVLKESSANIASINNQGAKHEQIER